MKDSLRLKAAYVGGNTRRWHVEDIIGEQRVSSHTWGMLAMYLLLCREPSLDVVRLITFHDAAESFSGDIPWFARQAHEGAQAADTDIGHRWYMAVGSGGDPATFTPVELWWLKTLDAAEAYLFSKQQIAMGNRLMTDPALACVSRLEMARQEEAAPDYAWDVVQAIFDTNLTVRLTRDIAALEIM